ncbi:MAG: quinone-dependent dihydroorotate dehydrogenase [Nanoarchaeota archaeon]
MYSLIKPVLFKFDPEDMHHFFVKIGKSLGSNALTRSLISALWKYDHPSLHTTVGGVQFNNPVGLAAGFDKYAELYKILPSIGFGFMELGSFTARPFAGNPRPRIFRLPEEKSILVNYGLNNEGGVAVQKKLLHAKFDIPAGMSVAKTNDPNMTEKEALEDYAKGFTLLHPLGSYTTVNVSCPSSFDGNTNTYSNPKYLPKLLERLDRCPHLNKPVFLKIKPDHDTKEVDQILAIARPYKWVTGFVLSNLLKKREGLKCKARADALCSSGGLSGALVKKKSNEQLAYAYKKGKGRFIFIGCGGIFTAEDAYEKIKLGASLVQLITGMIYEGPGLISNINKGLVELLKRDGYKNIQEAVGSKNGPA